MAGDPDLIRRALARLRAEAEVLADLVESADALSPPTRRPRG